MTDEGALGRAAAHVARFDEAVRSRDWAAFVQSFTADAHLDFADLPVGPFDGREAILAAYVADPPDDGMSVLSAEQVGPDTDLARFAWHRSGTGEMVITWRGGLVARLEVRFD